MPNVYSSVVKFLEVSEQGFSDYQQWVSLVWLCFPHFVSEQAIILTSSQKAKSGITFWYKCWVASSTARLSWAQFGSSLDQFEKASLLQSIRNATSRNLHSGRWKDLTREGRNRLYQMDCGLSIGFLASGGIARLQGCKNEEEAIVFDFTKCLSRLKLYPKSMT